MSLLELHRICLYDLGLAATLDINGLAVDLQFGCMVGIAQHGTDYCLTCCLEPIHQLHDCENLLNHNYPPVYFTIIEGQKYAQCIWPSLNKDSLAFLLEKFRAAFKFAKAMEFNNDSYYTVDDLKEIIRDNLIREDTNGLETMRIELAGIEMANAS